MGEKSAILSRTSKELTAGYAWVATLTKLLKFCKFNEGGVRGVQLRDECGPRDLEKQSEVMTRNA